MLEKIFDFFPACHVCSFVVLNMYKTILFSSLGDVFGPETQPTEEEFSAFYSAVLHNDGYAINHK